MFISFSCSLHDHSNCRRGVELAWTAADTPESCFATVGDWPALQNYSEAGLVLKTLIFQWIPLSPCSNYAQSALSWYLQSALAWLRQFTKLGLSEWVVESSKNSVGNQEYASKLALAGSSSKKTQKRNLTQAMADASLLWKPSQLQEHGSFGLVEFGAWQAVLRRPELSYRAGNSHT